MPLSSAQVAALSVALTIVVRWAPSAGPTLAAGQLRLVSVPASEAPKPFRDDILPMCYRDGVNIDGLGRILKLDTYCSPKSTSSMLTRFSIYNKYKTMEGIKFLPQLMCRLGNYNATFGPYQFNLDLLLQSGFNYKTRTVIYIPGYRSKLQERWIVEARKDWLELDEDVDVIEVSWSDSNKGVYSEAVAHTPLVARQVTLLLYYLAELSGISLYNEEFLSNIHLVGHSLGAHIAGFVGQDLNSQAGRITGLDPAGPSFDQFADTQRLSRTDAQFVDIIHTNRGKMKYMNMAAGATLQAISMLPGIPSLTKAISASYSGEGDTAWYGMDMQMGHVDYQANNGRVQPGCSGLLHICDHNRATDIYADIIRHERLLRSSLSNVGVSEVAEALKSSRLLAFEADSYDEFLSGENLAKNCGNLLDVSRHLSGEQVKSSMNDCTMPIDLVSHVNELREELKTNYPNKINFSPLNSTNYRKFYFKTLEDRPLIGDHYLVKVYFSVPPTWKDDTCSLEIKLEMIDSKNVTIELDRLFGSIDRPGVPLAVPFVHPDGVVARPKLIQLFDQVSRHNENQTTTIDERLVRRLLPDNIRLSLGKPKSKSVFGVVKDLTKKMIKMDDEQSCRFAIDLIEVHPVSLMMNEQAKNFAGLYTREGHLNYESLKHVKVGALNKLRRENLIARLAPEFQLNVKVGLESIVLND